MALLQWSRNEIRAGPKLLSEKKTRLQFLEENAQPDQSREEISLLRKEIQFLLNQEETYWRQRSRITWMREGDRNTSFFHAQASQRRKANTIIRLRHPNGS